MLVKVASSPNDNAQIIATLDDYTGYLALEVKDLYIEAYKKYFE